MKETGERQTSVLEQMASGFREVGFEAPASSGPFAGWVTSEGWEQEAEEQEKGKRKRGEGGGGRGKGGENGKEGEGKGERRKRGRERRVSSIS